VNEIEEELEKRARIRARGAEIGRKLMESKREMQEEAKRDFQKPEVRAALDELYKRIQNEGN
jgi:hypothetical protein